MEAQNTRPTSMYLARQQGQKRYEKHKHHKTPNRSAVMFQAVSQFRRTVSTPLLLI